MLPILEMIVHAETLEIALMVEPKIALLDIANARLASLETSVTPELV